MSRASGRNWYAVLSVGARTSLPIDGATHEDIKRRYKRLCLVLHPDKNPSAAADGAFKLLQEAWKTLSVLPRPPPARTQQAGAGGTSDSRSRPRARSPRAFRGGLCGHCWRKFYAAADGEEEELCMPCRERAREPTPPPGGADTPDRDTPSPPRRGCRRFPCPGLCAHCGAGYASSMVSVGMWNLHCASCHRYAKVHVRSPSSAEDASSLRGTFGETNQSELAAFTSYALAFPKAFLALVDTYDVMRSGVPNFCAVALALNDMGYKAGGIRLDSGDLAYLSIETRKFFCAIEKEFGVVGFGKTNITASNDLNEETIDALNKQGHEVDSFGIGTYLVTCYAQAALGCVFKLVEINKQPRIKLSEDVTKVSIPC
ncbi:hypothetical protein ACQ4PT_021698 [Festuca glaucescens]